MKSITFTVFMVLAVSATVFSAPQAELWDAWLPYDAESRIEVDHSAWDTILERYLITDDPSGVYLFAYSRVTPEDKASLEAYVRALEGVAVQSLNRDEQMAYWINMYNAVTVAVVLDHLPVKSIRDISLGGGLFTRGPWDASVVTVNATPLTLNDIEHRILRPIWNDPRIHYAVNCASIGCPNLQPEAFTARNLEQLLERAAREYINHERGVEPDGRTIRLSSIYDWFSEDFGGTRETILQHIHRYADAELREKLAPFLAGDGRLRYRYDWAINAP
ncbi:MAG: DUF547 domain-containing protein [Spirochaetaceae bacterium]|nr:MAG: DUF547 domain-containing protein [Spirochaetaceae bacterium]